MQMTFMSVLLFMFGVGHSIWLILLHKWHGILIGGLIDGFVTTTYSEALTIALDCENWSLVHILI